MNLMICEKCGTVFDRSRLKAPKIHDRMGKLLQDARGVWDDNKKARILMPSRGVSMPIISPLKILPDKKLSFIFPPILRDAVLALRVRAKINSQIVSVQAPAQQGAKTKEYQAYSVFSQHR